MELIIGRVRRYFSLFILMPLPTPYIKASPLSSNMQKASYLKKKIEVTFPHLLCISILFIL